MGNVTREAMVVALCDWQGRVVWSSTEKPHREVGDYLWNYATQQFRASVEEVFHEVIALRESREIEAIDEIGEVVRGWLWPLDSPEVAVCFLGVKISPEFLMLSSRERDCVTLLGNGASVGEIAAEFEISASTVHTHLRRAREKLRLSSMEALISFAARNSPTPSGPRRSAPAAAEPQEV